MGVIHAKKLVTDHLPYCYAVCGRASNYSEFGQMFDITGLQTSVE